MSLVDRISSAVADLDASGDTAPEVIARGFGLAVGAWHLGAEAEPSAPWDLFGLDLCAAAEAIHLSVAPVQHDEESSPDRRLLRREASRLVDALAAHLERTAGGFGDSIQQQLELHAAAAELRRAGGALR